MAKKGMFKGRLMCLAVAVVFGGCGGKNLAREEKNGYTERIEETVDAPIEERDTFMKAGNPMEGSEWGTPIYDIEDLESIGNTGNYILMEDIDCAGMEHGINDFEGEFEGNYHQLRNLGQALFSDSFSGTVRNLAIIDTVSDTAGLIEELHQGTVDNCYVTGVIGKSNEEETARAGLVQYMLGTDGCIRDSFNKADIYTTAGEKEQASAEMDPTGGGGIVGVIKCSDSEKEKKGSFSCSNCENYGMIFGDGRKNIGGICGNIVMENGMELCEISGCLNYGRIRVEGEESVSDGSMPGIGGVVGKIEVETEESGSVFETRIETSSNYGKLNNASGTKSVAGICGSVVAKGQEGSTVKIEVSDCLNAGKGSSDMAGICHSIEIPYAEMSIRSCLDLSGADEPVFSRRKLEDLRQARNLVIKNCYFLKYQEDDHSAVAKGLTPEEMRKQESFLGFSFADSGEGVWGMEAEKNNGYPYLVVSRGQDVEREDTAQEQDLEKEDIDAEKEKEKQEEEEEKKIASIIRNNCYANVLATIGQGLRWPGESEEIYREYFSEYGCDNYFSICDIDHDGKEELLVKIVSGTSMECRFVVFQHEEEEDVAVVEADFSASGEIYDNGIWIEYFLYDFDPGGSIKPYNVYRYDAQQDAYVYQGSAESLIEETGEIGQAFPNDMDKDGNGEVYRITDSDGAEVIMDDAEYERWKEQFVGGAKEVEISWQIIKSENYNQYTKEYIQYCAKRAEQEKDFQPLDIGYLYMVRENPIEDIKKVLAEEYGMEIRAEDADDLEYGAYDGDVQAVIISSEDMGVLQYKNAAKNITMFGAYPGMSVSEMEEKLGIYGFKKLDNKYGCQYFTGENMWNFFLYYEEEAGIVTSIGVYLGGSYIG